MINLNPDFIGKKHIQIVNDIINFNQNNVKSEKYTFIEGENGYGMSRIGQELKKVLEAPFFISINFNGFLENIPLSGIKKIINQILEIIDNNPSFKQQIAPLLKKNLMTDNSSLLEFIPGLRKYLEYSKGNVSLNLLLKTFFINLSSSNLPIIFFLDDFHFCDKSTIEIFDSLVNSNIPVHFIVTYRKGKNQKFDFYYEKIKNKSCLLNKFELNLFDLEDTKEILIAIFERELDKPEELAKILYDTIPTSPQMIIEIVKLLLQSRLVNYSQKWVFDTKQILSYKLPSTFEQILFQRLNRLSPKEIDILRFASAIGKNFNNVTLENISFKNPDLYDYSLISETLKQAKAYGIIQEVEKGYFIFSSNTVKEELHNSLNSEDKALFHEICAIDLQETHKDENQIIFELAYHYSRTDDLVKGINYLKKAAERALEMRSREEAMNFAQQAMESIRFTREDELSKDIKIDIAFTYIKALRMLGNYEKGIEILDQTKELIDENNDKRNLAFLYYWYGQLNFLLGNQIAAINWFSSCIPIAEEMKVEELLAVPYQVIGSALFFRGDFRKAIENLNNSLNYVQNNDPNDIARANGFLGWCYSYMGFDKKSHEYALITEKATQKIEDEDAKAGAYHLIGSIYFALGKYEKARSFEDRLVEIAKKNQNHIMVYSAYYSYAVGNYNNGKYGECIEWVNKAIKYSEEFGVKIGIHLIYEIYSYAELELKHYDKAIEIASKAVPIVMQLQNLYNASQLYRVIGASYYRRENPDFDNAGENLLKSKEFADQIDIPKSSARIYGEYTAFLYKKGDLEKAKEIETKFNAILKKADLNFEKEYFPKLLNKYKKGTDVPPENISETRPVEDVVDKTEEKSSQKAEDTSNEKINLAVVPDGIYTLDSIMDYLINIIFQNNQKGILNKLFEYIFSFSGFERGFFFTFKDGKFICMGGVDKNLNDVTDSCNTICKQVLRNAVIQKNNVYIENAFEDVEYNMIRNVYNRKIKSIYASTVLNKNFNSIIYLETTENTAEVGAKVKELIKHFQKIISAIILNN